MIVAIDFDGVLHDAKARVSGRKMGAPIEGSRDAVLLLRQRGDTLIVFTLRGDRPQHVEDWLKFYKFPPMRVTRSKPEADVYLDDRALRFTNWADALKDLKGMR